MNVMEVVVVNLVPVKAEVIISIVLQNLLEEIQRQYHLVKVSITIVLISLNLREINK